MITIEGHQAPGTSWLGAIMAGMTTAIDSPNRSDAEVEAAIVLLGSGLSSVKVAELTGIPASTLRDWARSSALVAKYGEAIREARVRIAMRTSQIVEQLLDDIEDGTVKVSPVQAATMWGIATDKVQRDSTGPKTGSFVTIRTSDGTVIEAGSASKG